MMLHLSTRNFAIIACTSHVKTFFDYFFLVYPNKVIYDRYMDLGYLIHCDKYTVFHWFAELHCVIVTLLLFELRVLSIFRYPNEIWFFAQPWLSFQKKSLTAVIAFFSLLQRNVQSSNSLTFAMVCRKMLQYLYKDRKVLYRLGIVKMTSYLVLALSFYLLDLPSKVNSCLVSSIKIFEGCVMSRFRGLYHPRFKKDFL